jgi:hypothetical protein
MRKANLKQLAQVLTPKERAKLVAGYYVLADEENKSYQHEVDKYRFGLTGMERAEYTFYASLIHEINYTLGPDMQITYLRLLVHHKDLTLILSCLHLVNQPDLIDDDQIQKRVAEIVIDIKSLYSRLLGYIDGIKGIEDRFFNSEYVISRKTWFAKFALEKYEEIQKDYVVVTDLIQFRKTIISEDEEYKTSLQSNPEMDQKSSDLIQEKLIQWAINDSGYKP